MENNLPMLWGNALDSDKRDIFVSEWSTSSIWGDVESDDQLIKIAEYVGKVWDAAHMTTRQIVTHAGLSQAAFAARYTIPKRTVESWCMGERTPPDYVRFLLLTALGIF